MRREPSPLKTEDEARELCRRLALAFQKSRSNLLESGLADVAEILNPWLFGGKSILPLLDDIAHGARAIDTNGMLNILYIANRPEMLAFFGIWQASYQDDAGDLPSVEEFLRTMVAQGWEWAP